MLALINLVSCDNPVGTEEAELNVELNLQTAPFTQTNITSGGSVTLFAGQDIDVGEVRVEVVDGKLEVTFEITNENWCLKETHLHVWGDGEQAPVNDTGNPVPGQFEYSKTHACVGSYTYPIDEDPNSAWNIAAHAVVSNEQGAEAILYGTQRNNGTSNGLYKINLDSGTQELLFTAGGSGNSPNALGFDPVNERLYYMKYVGDNGPSTLYSHVLGTTLQEEAGLITPDLVVGASFYDGAYYYIPNLTADLHKVTFNNDGSVSEDIILYNDFNGPDNPAVYRYGDFAINDKGILYSSSNGTSGSTAEFFKLDILTGVYTLIADEDPINYALGLQVSFGSDGTLFAHNAATGFFYTVNLDDGALTVLGNPPNIGLFSDLASGALFILQEETAWGAGARFVEKGNWATYFKYTGI